MSDFKAKLHQIRFRLWLRLQRFPRLPSWIKGGLLLSGGDMGRDGRKGRGRQGREGTPNILLHPVVKL